MEFPSHQQIARHHHFAELIQLYTELKFWCTGDDVLAEFREHQVDSGTIITALAFALSDSPLARQSTDIKTAGIHRFIESALAHMRSKISMLKEERREKVKWLLPTAVNPMNEFAPREEVIVCPYPDSEWNSLLYPPPQEAEAIVVCPAPTPTQTPTPPLSFDEKEEVTGTAAVAGAEEKKSGKENELSQTNQISASQTQTPYTFEQTNALYRWCLENLSKMSQRLSATDKETLSKLTGTTLSQANAMFLNLQKRHYEPVCKGKGKGKGNCKGKGGRKPRNFIEFVFLAATKIDGSVFESGKENK